MNTVKHHYFSRFIPFLLALLLTASALGAAVIPAGTADAAQRSSIDSAADSAASYIIKGGEITDWQAVALARGGYKLPASYSPALVKEVQEAKGTYSRVTDYARRVLGAAAAGLDPANVGGFNLLEGVYNNSKMAAQGINGPIYSLIALDASGKNIPANALWTADKLAAAIAAKQNADGGFSLSGNSDPDLTAMALTALSAHTGSAGIAESAKKAADWLSKNQQSHGGYGASSESVAQAVIALSSSGSDPAGAAYTKGGVNLLDRLLTFKNSDGGFAHTQGGKSDSMATEQALEALVAYKLYADGKGRLFAFTPAAALPAPVDVTVTIEGPQSFIGEGGAKAATALEALKQMAAASGIKLDVASMSFGDYVAGIKDISGGMYGGYDGWNYAVLRGGQWVFPDVGMADFKLQAKDHIVVYYGDGTTQVISSLVISPSVPKAGEAFKVSVTKASYDWQAGKVVETPAAGVQVSVGSAFLTTDQAGSVSFAAGTFNHVRSVTVTGYTYGKSPSVVRFETIVTANSKFADESKVSSWALSSVYTAYKQGLMEGIGGGSQPVFAPKTVLTRAQFAALLVRLTGHEPAVVSTPAIFGDVKPGVWYYGYVMKAKELGFIEGVTAAAFGPDLPVSRQDMAVMIARAYQLKPSTKAVFADAARIRPYAAEAVQAVAEKGLMTPFKGAFDPASPVTREMAAVIAVRLK